jgi:hypothetical protein
MFSISLFLFNSLTLQYRIPNDLPVVSEGIDEDVDEGYQDTSIDRPISHPRALPRSTFHGPSSSPYSLSTASLTSASSPVPFADSSTCHPGKLPSEDAFPSRPSSKASSLIEDVLSQGDLVGEGLLLQGEAIRLVSTRPLLDSKAPANRFETVKKLEIGSYAVIYLVREVLSPPVSSADDRITLEGIEHLTSHPTVEYGRDFAIKCLPKGNLDEPLAVQMAEVRCIS